MFDNRSLMVQVCMYVFLKGKFEVTYVTFCGEIAGERLLGVGYIGCLGKGWREG